MLIPLVIPVLAAGLGCRDSATKAENLAKDQSTVSLQLAADPSAHYRKVEVFVTRLDVKAGPSWKPLASRDKALDLLGGPENLAREVRLERGSYNTLRLTVDPARCAVEKVDGTRLPLGVHQNELFVTVGQGPVTDNLIQDLVLNVDVDRSIHTNAGGGLVFSPRATLDDRSALGEISGRLVDGGGQPLAKVPVLIESGEGDQVRTWVRTVRTGDDGTFKADLLAVHHTYYAVAQPRRDGTVYGAQATAGLKLTPAVRRKTAEFEKFQPAPLGSPIEGTVSRPLETDHYQEVELLAKLRTGDREGHFILQGAGVPPGGRFSFTPVPPGAYEVILRRAPLGAQGPREVHKMPVEVRPDVPTPQQDVK